MLLRRKPEEETVGEKRAPSARQAAKPAEEPEAVLRDESGLYHRWYLELRLREELDRAASVDSVFSLAAWRLNALPGETPDSELLARSAALIKSSLRSYDVPARIDSERFVAILADADHDSAATVAFRIKADLQVRVPSAARWQAGVATFPRDGLDGDSLIHATLRRLEEDARAA